MPITPLDIDGLHFVSKVAACRHFNLSLSTVNHRLDRGYTLGQAFELDPRDRPKTNHWAVDIRNPDGEIVSYGCYRLYEIVNLIDGKAYIGLTVQTLKRRFDHHLYLARRSSYPLYRAMRKYGIENFIINLIRDDAKNGIELQQQERIEIERRDTVDRDKGYNIHPGGTSGAGKSIAIGDLKFSTHSEAAHYYGVTPAAFNLRLGRLGWTPEQAAEIEPPPNIKRYKINIGDETMSLRQAAKQVGANYKNVHLRIQNGWTIEQALGLIPHPDEKNLNIPVEIDGIHYRTLKDAAKAHGIGYQTVHSRLQYQKLTVRQALGLDPFEPRVKTTGKQIEAFGQTYASITACAKAVGVKMANLSRRMIEYGDTPEQAIAFLTRNR